MKYIPLFAVFALVCGLVLHPVQARTGFQLSQLYTASVPVAQQNSSDLKQALKETLAKVLVRVTGQTNASQLPGADDILNQASKLVSQYGYQSTDKGLELQATFDAGSVDQAVRNHNMPLWGRERPTTLVLLVEYGNGGRQLVGRQGASQQAAGLLSGARDRGLPLVFPDLSGSDLKAADVTGDFQDRIEKAAKSYQARNVVYGQIRSGQGGWHGALTLLSNGHVESRWQVSGDSENDALNALANDLADAYAKRYAIAANGQPSGATMVDVDNINSLADYAHVSRYLNSLTAVNDAQIVSLQGHTARFRVTSDSGRGYLSRAIALSSRFHHEQAPASPPGNAPAQQAAPAAAGTDTPPTGQGSASSTAGSGGATATPLRYRYQP